MLVTAYSQTWEAVKGFLNDSQPKLRLQLAEGFEVFFDLDEGVLVLCVRQRELELIPLATNRRS